MRATRLTALLTLLGFLTSAAQGACPVSTRPTGLPGRTPLLADQASTIAVFSAKLRRDDDGAPNAYHACGASYPDAGCTTGQYGLDHICSGVTVRDASGKRVPPSERPDASKPPNSLRCLATFRAAQAANYPKCGQNLACVTSWPGVVLTTRHNESGLATSIPAIRKGGPYDGYYISQTTLGRRDTDVPGGRSYLDARRIPYVVVPGKSVLVGNPWHFGSTSRADLALVIARRQDGVYRAAFAVVGETGPAGETGEVSSGLLQMLRDLPLSAERRKPQGIPGDMFKQKATVILFRHSPNYPMVGRWPTHDLTASEIQEAGRNLLTTLGGIESFYSCGEMPKANDKVEFAAPK